MESIKQRIKNGETVHGTWLSLGSATNAEIIGQAGFDWLMIDLEHGMGTLADVLGQLRALAASSTAVFVRSPNHDSSTILKLLDLGVDGVMVPQITGIDEATKIIKCMQYPPEGTRGMAPTIRATQFGTWTHSYQEHAQESIVGILQVETKSMLAELGQIVQLEGADVFFIGPVDLSMSLGIYGQYDHPLFEEAVQHIVATASAAGKAVGIILFNEDDYEKYHGLGIRVLAAGSDTSFISQGANRIAAMLDEKRALLE